MRLQSLRIKMKNRLIAGLSAAMFAAAIFSGTADAAPKFKINLSTEQVKTGKHRTGRKAKVTPEAQERVVSLIKEMAPRYGVPTWFALRIAKVESGYNPNTRGAAGEYGVYQMKCATARGIGFSGNCAQLLNASTNVQYGLKHLQMAMKLSHGNLRMAASKHNGGLGCKKLVQRYVAMIF
jgi:soluble lytic murein transglycosylase-like protein